jgi:apolipoprotein N-acyltransferase
VPEKATGFKVRMVARDHGVLHDGGLLGQYVEMSGADGAEDIDLFVWPENAMHRNLLRDGADNPKIAAVNNGRSFLATGFIREEPAPGEGDSARTVRYNSIGVFDRDGLTLVYDKIRLAPFGEYRPLWMPVMLAQDDWGSEYAAGTSRTPIRLYHMRAMPYVCFEITFPGLRIPGNVDFAINVSNDMWLPAAGKRHHFGQVRMRAVEEGVPIVRAADSGTSAVISPTGRIVARMEGSGVLDAYLPARAGRTLFSYTGNWLLITALSAWLAFMILSRGKGGKKGGKS